MRKHNFDSFKTICIITTGLLLLFLLYQKNWLLYAGLVLMCVALISRRASNWINASWMKLAFVMGEFVPKIILSLLFFLVLCPLAFSWQLFKKHKQFFLSRKHKSTFIEINKKFSATDFENPW